MDRYSTFHFEDCQWIPHGRKIVLRYSLDREISFEETLILPQENLRPDNEIDHNVTKRLLRALHLIGGISYYKTCIPRTIALDHGSLTQHEAGFWDWVYENGLGQFFFQNDIDFRGLIKFPWTKGTAPSIKLTATRLPLTARRILIPIGGGKDSMVTLELLRKSGAHLSLLRLGGEHPVIDELAHAAGLPLLTVKRSLSDQLFKLNSQGALNGHIPITAYLSILSVLVAELYGFDAVAMSNESSASEGNIAYRGLTVNHQWSKSMEFELRFQRFLRETIGTTIEYFSALRPFTELKIAEMFSRFPQYFTRVTSCNANWKISAQPQGDSLWCSRCPKCAFVFAILSAFHPRKTLDDIFGSILFEDESLTPLFRELLGLENFKPFECVGTAEETKAALLLAHRRGDLEDTAIMTMFVRDVLPTIADPEKLIQSTLNAPSRHCIPKQWEEWIVGNEL